MAKLSEVLDLLEEKEDLDWSFVQPSEKEDNNIKAMIAEDHDTMDFLKVTINPGMLNWEVVVTNNTNTERFKVGILNNERMDRLEGIYDNARSSILESKNNIDVSEYT